MYQFIKTLLFQLDPERAHHFTMKWIKRLRLGSLGLYDVKNDKLIVKKSGLTFRNPVGLAAGFDKDAKYIKDLAGLGFGFIEIGTVTPKPQPGNDKPRLFRLIQDNAIINRMGFNNDGVDAAVERLRNTKTDILIGGNIGKNKITPNENAISDYINCFRALHDYVDYFVVNISSPNTPGLRDLQTASFVGKLFQSLRKEEEDFTTKKPVLLKIAPDLTDAQLEDLLEVVVNEKIDGVIATNTTIDRDGLLSNTKREMGGLSGAPLTNKSTEIIKKIRTKAGADLLLIGVGGIMNPKDALEKLQAGADVIQLYTGFIYGGPRLIKDINKELLKSDFAYR